MIMVTKKLMIQTIQRFLSEMKDPQGKQAWQQQIQMIQEMSESEFQIYIQHELTDLPHICDFCDGFSGNRGIPRNSDFGICCYAKSIYYQKTIHEKSTCPQWNG